MAARAQTPPILAPKVRDLFFDASGTYIPSSWKVMYGGRAGLKSWGFGRVAVALAVKRRVRFLCAREFQNSIAESVHYVLKTQIETLDLSRYFSIGESSITSYTGSEFIFKGLHRNISAIRSTEAVDVCWIEEASNVGKEEFRIITPTIFRKPGAEIWVGFNPDQPEDPVSQMFIERPIPNARIVQTSWRDNPWLPQAEIEDKDYLARVDADAYHHVWEGGYRKNSKAQIFAGKCSVQAFEVDSSFGPPMQGVDWGFSQDPLVMVRCYVKGTRLYISHEAWALGRDLHRTAELFDQIPDARKYVSRADSARPESVSYMQQHGYPRIESVEKWPGSVEDGIAFLRQFEEIVIHQRCTHMAQESRLYSYKIDPRTLEPTTEIVDRHNHCWDGVRYALAPMIKTTESGMLRLARLETERMRREAEEAKEKAR